MLLGIKSYVLSFSCLATMLAGGWWVLNCRYHYYLEVKVVGMVGAQQSEKSEDEMVLKLLCVGREHRRKGMAKALCLKVSDFAEACGGLYGKCTTFSSLHYKYSITIIAKATLDGFNS
ncbi:hypothetical protein XELAEV_18008756mg [Xenopus laevis]|uniref:N-acetyltransferase domain-containing protein n=1 Tax=Xenopus laevis TaxID=8355 RepID=A0A974DS83_XENLA|nr:hypothetical protein XELAEV_18008756mg [Xenopus laevis]